MNNPEYFCVGLAIKGKNTTIKNPTYLTTLLGIHDVSPVIKGTRTYLRSEDFYHVTTLISQENETPNPEQKLSQFVIRRIK